uniref:ubiquitinyl hydrolase 1 n=1 Tax=Lutzomyia longipalpis TaxID=7200 RepID=A0A1B0C8T8_LUTLO
MAWNSKCPHMENVVQLSLAELCKLKQGIPCTDCDACGPNLWICLDKNCLYMGCSEQYNDHSTKHFKLHQTHAIHMNLSSQRIWCYLCQQEVFLGPQRRPSGVSSNDSSESPRHTEKILVYERSAGGGESCGESSAEEEDQACGGDRRQFGGLVGLQNIANTCYMNAALQALSNTPPLTGYFLDCGAIADYVSEQSTSQQPRKPGLAKSYHRLIREIWCRNNMSSGYVVPSGILQGIRSLHEELKDITPPPPDVSHLDGDCGGDDEEDEEGDDAEDSSTPSPSQSEAEYETCDSGVSEQSTASDDGESDQMPQQQRRRRYLPAVPQPQQNIRRQGRAVQQHASQVAQQVVKNPPRRSIISDVFDGKLLSSVQCLTCDRVSTREETFQDLSLPIPGKDHLTVLHQTQQMVAPGMVNSPSIGGGGITCTDTVYQGGQDGWLWWLWSWLRSWFWGPAVTLHDCMAAFFSADELKNDNMYSCEKCNKLRNGIKYSRVLALPEMLCVHLKRFRHDLSYSSKISSPVHFPLHGLDMRPYLHRDCQSEVSTYDLTAVICHHGTVGGGHYTSIARHDPSGKWFEFDDQLVTQVTPDVVQNCEAYVLFYRKSNHQIAQLRAQALEIVNTSPPQASDIRFFVSKQWLNRFNTFAEPGPIDNWALLCPHGGLPPGKVALVSKLVVPLPQPLWDFFYEKFGGGPACNHFFECDTCRRAAESLTRRQKAELVAFMSYNDEFRSLETPSVIYAISMAWFRQWQLFARGVTTDEPGPITNASIAQSLDTIPIRSVKAGSDYAQINEKLWKFFHGIYGGGPEILLRGNPQDDVKSQRIEKAESEEMEMEDVQDTSMQTVEPSHEEGIDGVAKEEDVPPEVPEEETNGPTEEESADIQPPSAMKMDPPANGEKRIPKNVSFEDAETLTNGSEKDSSSAKEDSSTNVTETSRSYTSRKKMRHENERGKRENITNVTETSRSYTSRKKMRHENERGKRENMYRKPMKKSPNLFGPEGAATPKINGVANEDTGDVLPLLHTQSIPAEVTHNGTKQPQHSNSGHKSHHRRKRI